MPIVMIEGPYRAFIEEMCTQRWRSDLLLSPPFCPVEPMPRTDALTESNVLYVAPDYAVYPAALNYAVLNSDTKTVCRGTIFQEDMPELRDILGDRDQEREVLARLKQPQYVNKMLEITTAVGHTSFITGLRRKYRDLILMDMQRLHFSLLQNSGEADCFLQQGLEKFPLTQCYAQGTYDDRTFINMMNLFNPAWQLLLFDAQNFPSLSHYPELLGCNDQLHNMLKFGFPYLARRDGREEPAALSACCRRGAADLWLLSWVTQPHCDIDERRRTLVLPDKLVPPKFLAAIRSGGTLFTVNTYERFSDCNLSSLGNQGVVDLVSSLFVEEVCCEQRFKLLTKTKENRDYYEELLQRMKFLQSDYLSKQDIELSYCDIRSLTGMLREIDYSEQLVATRYIKSALQCCLNDRYIKCFLSKMQAWLQPQSLVEAEQELLDCVNTLISATAEVATRQRALLTAQMRYSIWHIQIAGSSSNYLCLLHHLRDNILPWVLEVGDAHKIDLVPNAKYCLEDTSMSLPPEAVTTRSVVAASRSSSPSPSLASVTVNTVDVLDSGAGSAASFFSAVVLGENEEAPLERGDSSPRP